MCTNHQLHGISRRGFGAMTLAGAGLTLMPLRAAVAADVVLEALCIMCIDYRLVDSAVEFFDTDPRGPGRTKYDLVALAGASLAGTRGGLFTPTQPGFWQQVYAARKLHNIKRVIVLDHMDCGAFKTVYGANITPEQEHEFHIDRMKSVRQTFDDAQMWAQWELTPPPNGIEFFLTSPVEQKTYRMSPFLPVDN